MIEKVFSETIYFTGEVGPKNLFEIDRKEILYNIAESYYENKYVEDTDYLEIVNSKAINQLVHWWKDAHFFYRSTESKMFYKIINHKNYGYHILPNEGTLKKNHIDPFDLHHSPDYVFLYCVDVQKDSSQLVIEFDDHRRKNRWWKVNLENNYFYFFPSSLNYYITKNKSNRINTLLIQTYEEIR